MKLLIAYYKFLKFILVTLGLLLIVVSSIGVFLGEEWLEKKIGGTWSFERPELGLLVGFLLIIVFLVFVFLEKAIKNKR